MGAIVTLLIVAIQIAILVFVINMMFRLVRAVEQIADKSDRTAQAIEKMADKLQGPAANLPPIDAE